MKTKKFNHRIITDKIFPAVYWTLLSLWCLILLLSLVWALFTSLKGGLDFATNPVGIPKKWMFGNYSLAINEITVKVRTPQGAYRDVYFGEMILNSLMYGLGAPLFAVISAAISSYVASKYRQFRFVAGLYALVIFTTFIPLSPSLAANLKLLRDLGLYNKMIGMYIWSSGAFGFMFLVYYATFKGVSWSYAEAAFIDGAGHFQVFVLLMLPLTKTVFGALYINSFIGIWNDYMTPMIYLPSYPTVAYGAWIFQYSANQSVSSITVKLAGLLTVAAPILILFIAFKNKLIGALTYGGLKG